MFIFCLILRVYLLEEVKIKFKWKISSHKSNSLIIFLVKTNPIWICFYLIDDDYCKEVLKTKGFLGKNFYKK